MDLMEQAVGLCAFEVLCQRVKSRLEDGELVSPCGLGHGLIAYLHDKAPNTRFRSVGMVVLRQC